MKVVFIDEIPWMDSPRSNFLSALEHFWNGWASARKDILLIVCSSATSWIINKVIKNHGGLHNRVSNGVCPYSSETVLLKGNANSIPKKWDCALSPTGFGRLYDHGRCSVLLVSTETRNESGTEHQPVIFLRRWQSRHEFDDLYDSLFKQPKPYLSIVDALATKKVGMTRTEILQTTKLTDNGKLTEYF